MSRSSGVVYDPVPHADSHSPSSSPQPGFDPYAAYPPDSPYAQHHAGDSSYTLPPDLDDAPPRPRFMGAAAGRRDPTDPTVRASLASSNFFHDGGRGSEGSSVYALNDMSADGAEQHRGVSRMSSFQRYLDDPNHANSQSDHAHYGRNASPTSHHALGSSPAGATYMPEKRAAYAPGRRGGRRVWIIGGIVAGVLLLLAIAIPVAVVESKHKSSSNVSGDKKGGDGSHTATDPSGGNKSKQSLAVSGGAGSTVTTEDGSTFTYQNSFGGTWYYDENDPFNNAAQANSWTPPLNQSFVYGVNRIWGVNLGGWLNTEPFIVPALYEPYQNTSSPAIDEWTLTTNLRADNSLSKLEDHYKTFITEEDFAQIAGAGLNFVRIPLPYWAIEVRQGEPFLANTCWTYFLKAIAWARKYGIRINVDLHTVPGSQNGWNHSGKFGTIGWLHGPMGVANAQRALDYIRILAEFVSQPQYRDVVAMFGIINEPFGPTIGQNNIERFYVQAYDIVRTASGAGNGPTISFHEAFEGLGNWQSFLPGADNVALDNHPYLCFVDQISDTMADHVNDPCKSWGSMMNSSLDTFGMTAAGEFALAMTDCGLFVNGVNLGTRYEGDYVDPQNPKKKYPPMGSCAPWVNWESWDADMKSAMSGFAHASMDALQNWFFWTWKIGNSTVSGTIEAPAWSYQLGLQQGWIPQDPRSALGTCNNTAPRAGGAIPKGTGVADAATASFPWPPTSISAGGAASLLPTYTPTSALVTLPAPTPMAVSGGPTPTASANAGNGWNNPSDTAQMMVAIPTCSYLDPWVDPSTDPPSPLCGGSSRRSEYVPPHAPRAVVTPPPHA